MNANVKKIGKTYAKVVFLMQQDLETDRWQPMAYFPDLPWNGYSGNKTCFTFKDGHAPCCEAFALLDCKAPQEQHFSAVAKLKRYLESEPAPYVLTVLDAAEWLKSNGERRKEIDRNIFNAHTVQDSEAMFAANKATAEKRRKNVA